MSCSINNCRVEEVPRNAPEKINAITSELQTHLQNHFLGTTKDIANIIGTYLENYKCFGVKEWADLGYEVEKPPALSENFLNFWNGQCPIFKGKAVYETHNLVYLPKTISGMDLTLKKLKEISLALFQKDMSYTFMTTGCVNDLEDIPVNESTWVVAVKGLIPEVLNKDFSKQQEIIDQLGTELIQYQVSNALETAFCLWTESIMSRNFLLPNANQVALRTRDVVQDFQIVVQDLAKTTFSITHFPRPGLSISVLAIRKL